MLILVAVTITMAVNGGLFNYAGEAGRKTNTAVAEEQNLANLESNLTVNQLIDKYSTVENQQPTIITFTISEDTNEYTAYLGETWLAWYQRQNRENGQKIDLLEESYNWNQGVGVIEGMPYSVNMFRETLVNSDGIAVSWDSEIVSGEYSITVR